MHKWNKRMIAMMPAMMLLAVPSTSLAMDISVHVDGRKQHYDVAPYLKDDRTLVPLRGIFESLGANVQWDAATDTITATKGDRTVRLRIGSRIVMLNGQQVELEAPPEVTDGRTMVPIRLISQALGADVKWDSLFNAVRITSADRLDKTLNLVLKKAPTSLDSLQATGSDNVDFLQQTGEGLVRLDQHGKIVPGVAESWIVEPDKRSYTFRLRDNAKWSDGTQVTAQDFEYAWKRAVDPTVDSPYSYLFWGINRAYNYNQGQGPRDDVGVRAIDDRTLKVYLGEPQTYFLQLLTGPAFFPQREASLELYNGPFKLVDWEGDRSLLLKKNENYWDHDHVQLEQVNFIVNPETQWNDTLYADGVIDRLPLNRDNYEKWDGKLGFKSTARDTVFFINFNQQGPKVLQNKNIRKALTYAVSGQALANVILHDGSYGANAFVPPSVADDNGQFFQQQEADLLQRDQNAPKAKTFLEAGMKELGLTEFPKLHLLVHDTPTSQKQGEFIRGMWREELGIDVELEYAPFKEAVQRQMKHDYDLSVAGWQGDYNDPLIFMEPFTTGDTFNDRGYSRKEFDQLIADVRKETDIEKRTALLHEAEKMLLDDLPIAPLYFTSSSFVTQPYVKGMIDHGHGALYDLKYVHIEGRN
ncbi:MAG: ABC transporter substrate-binding protein [Tumebacillaceae bacterium]